MDRLNLVNIKQEVHDDQQQDNEEMSQDRKSPNDCIKLEVDNEQREVPINAQQQPQQKCNRVKKEENGGEMELVWDGDECACEECRVERQIKIEFNRNNNAIENSLQQGNRCPGTSSEAKRSVPSQSSVCKRVKKEEEEDGEWDEDCDCDDCRRMRLKAIRLKQNNDMQNGGAGGDDGEETEIDEDWNDSEDVLVGNDGNMAVDDQIGDEDGDELDQEGELTGDGQESSEDQMSDADDETEIDDEEYEMEVGAEESQTVEDAPIETTLPQPNGQNRKIVRQSARHLKRKKTDQDQEIATECTTNPIQPNLAKTNRHLQCSHCSKSFVYLSGLQRHLRVHTSERPFQCDQCDKRFSERGNLTKHQFIHQNIKRFRCDQCGKQLTYKRTLEDHQRTHSGERPFKCRYCEMSFTKSNTRIKHEKAIHLHVKPNRCKQCGHTATDRAAVIRHVREVHFGLPRSIKKQQTLNIVDRRDPRELIEKV